RRALRGALRSHRSASHGARGRRPPRALHRPLVLALLPPALPAAPPPLPARHRRRRSRGGCRRRADSRFIASDAATRAAMPGRVREPAVAPLLELEQQVAALDRFAG